MKRMRDLVFGNSSVEQKTETIKDKLSILNARKDDICKELEYEEIQPGKKPREEVRHWLTAVDEVQSKFKDGQGKGSSSNSQDTGLLERSIAEIDELIRRGQFSNGLVLPDHQGTRLPLLLDKKLVGQKLQQNTEKILGWLQNVKHDIMGVYGMGGVGKTTLLMQIHNLLLQDSNVYGRVYWVTVSQNCSAHKLQKDIAKALGVDSLGADDGMKRAAMLHSKLAANGPTILILDDMWESFLGTEVGIPLEESSCKIILSTRSLEVCRKMGCKELIIKAEILSEKEAWELFVDKLGHYDTLSSEAKDIAKNVAQECGGLPLAIATVARSMSGIVDIYDWRNALTELQSVCRIDGMNDDVLPKLQFSYDRLNNKMVQHCFLSCILYPEDEIINRETLIDLWIDEGLLDEIESREAQVAKGHAILNRLENWCLLESTPTREIKGVKMHDLIRDMAIMITKDRFIAKSGTNLEKLPEEKQWSEDLVKVSLRRNPIREIPCDMAPFTPQLTVLMLNHNRDLKVIPESLFKHMTALTVLDLSWTSIERLPESVSDLVNLRALLLNNCKHLNYVPSLEKLSKLRVLDLQWDTKLAAAPKGIERLKCLEKVTDCHWDVSDISRFNKLIHSSPPLSSYRFWLLDSTRFVPSSLGDDLRNCRLSNDSTLFSYEKTVWIEGVKYGEDKASPLIPTSVEYLVIIDSDMKGISLGAATDLLKVDIENCRGLEYIISSSSSSGSHQGSSICPQLETLEELMLDELPDLRRIIKSGGCSFSNLGYLTISKCPKIKAVIPFTGDQLYLPNLTNIKVEDCEEVEDIFESNDSIEPNPILTFPKLQKMELHNLPKLRRIYRGLLICESMGSKDVQWYWEDTPKLELLSLSLPLICDASRSTLASVTGNTELWEMLHRDYPKDAKTLSDHINKPPQPASLSNSDDTSEWVDSDSTDEIHSQLVPGEEESDDDDD